MSSRRRYSIDRKLPLLISGLLLATTVAVAGAAYVRARHALLAAAGPRLHDAARAIDFLLAQSVAVATGRLGRTATDPVISTFLATGRDSATARHALTQIWNRDPAPRGRIALRRADGRVLLDTTVGAVPSDSRWTEQTIASGMATDTIPRVAPLNASGSVVYYEALVPILAPGSRQPSTTTGHGSRSDVVGYVSELLALSGANAQTVRDLIGARSTMLLGSPATGVWTDLQHLTGPPPDGIGVDRPQAFVQAGRPPGVGVRVAVPGTPWVLWVEQPQSVILDPMHPLLRDIALLASVVILVGGCAAWFLSRHITRPIMSLTAVAERIAADGDQPVRSEEGQDEVERLGEAFVRMLHRVRESLATAEGARAEAEALARGLQAQTVTLDTQRREAQALADELEQQFEEAQSLSEELEQSNEKLRRSVLQAEAANKAKLDFLTHMSHELRTPLNAIGGYVQLLEMQVAGPVLEEQRRYLARIARAESALLGRINDILNFAKIDSGTLAYTVTAVEVHGVLAATISLMQPLLAQRELTCVYGGTDSRVSVLADGEKLEQILLNLLSNATKFTPRGGQIMVVSTTHADAVEISVADTGIGIPPDKLATIFEPFTQVNPSLTREQEGTGLGLAISRELARGMGGELTAVSVERSGSTFALRLPLAAIHGSNGRLTHEAAVAATV
jgi:signal transduction histidine kinase